MTRETFQESPVFRQTMANLNMPQFVRPGPALFSFSVWQKTCWPNLGRFRRERIAPLIGGGEILPGTGDPKKQVIQFMKSIASRSRVPTQTRKALRARNGNGHVSGSTKIKISSRVAAWLKKPKQN